LKNIATVGRNDSKTKFNEKFSRVFNVQSSRSEIELSPKTATYFLGSPQKILSAKAIEIGDLVLNEYLPMIDNCLNITTLRRNIVPIR
jgi:hypothetical protein